jgi:DNA mismatch repair ATPase MutS
MSDTQKSKIKITPKSIRYDSNGASIYKFDSAEVNEILRNNFDADLVIVDETGKELRTVSTKDYLAATAFLHLQRQDKSR